MQIVFFFPLSLSLLPWWQLLPGSSGASRGVSVHPWLEESSAERAPRLSVTWWWSCGGRRLICDWSRLSLCLIPSTELLLYIVILFPVARVYSNIRVLYVCFCLIVEVFFWSLNFQRFVFFVMFCFQLRLYRNVAVEHSSTWTRPTSPSAIKHQGVFVTGKRNTVTMSCFKYSRSL